MRRPFVLALLLLLLPVAGQATVARIDTLLGVIDVQLYDEEAPITVGNFLAYANPGDDDGSFIHRSAIYPTSPPS